MAETQETGYENTILTFISENVYVGLGLGAIYLTVWGLSVLVMLGFILVEKFHWRTPILVKFFAGNDVFADFAVVIFCIMQSLTIYLLENYQIIPTLQHRPPVCH